MLISGTDYDTLGVACYLAATVSDSKLPPERSDYPHSVVIQTRWHDNDIYGHINNVVYYSFFDTAINRVLILEGGLDIHAGEVIGLCAESHCEFLGPLEYPNPVEARLRIGHLGKSSVRYEIALFDGESGPAAAKGWFVHVFVGRDDRRPAEIPAGIRAALEPLVSAQ